MASCVGPPRQEGRTRRHERGAGCDGRGDVDTTNDVAADGEVVWSWRPDAGAKFAKMLPRLASDGGKRARSPGRSRISRKTIAQGRPDDPPVPVVLPRAFCCTRTMGAVGTRPSLRPLLLRGPWFPDNSGAQAGREGGRVSDGYSRMLHRVLVRYRLFCRIYQPRCGFAHAPIRPPRLISSRPCRYLTGQKPGAS